MFCEDIWSIVLQFIQVEDLLSVSKASLIAHKMIKLIVQPKIGYGIYKNGMFYAIDKDRSEYMIIKYNDTYAFLAKDFYGKKYLRHIDGCFDRIVDTVRIVSLNTVDEISDIDILYIYWNKSNIVSILYADGNFGIFEADNVYSLGSYVYINEICFRPCYNSINFCGVKESRICGYIDMRNCKMIIPASTDFVVDFSVLFKQKN